MADDKYVQEHINKLSELPVADVADALRSFGVPHGGFLPDLRMLSPEMSSKAARRRMSGPAWIVKFEKNGAGEQVKGHYIDTLPPRHVLLISAPPNLPNALFGGIMSRRAKYVKASGVVVDGRIRDLAEHWDTEMRIYARDTGTTAPGEVCHPSVLNVPVTLNPTSYCSDYTPTIHPGDWLHGDLDGVVCIPHELLQRVIEKARDIGVVDAKVADDVENGAEVSVAMAKWRKAGSR